MVRNSAMGFIFDWKAYTIYYAVSFDQSEGSILSLRDLSKRPSYTKALLLEYNTFKGVYQMLPSRWH